MDAFKKESSPVSRLNGIAMNKGEISNDFPNNGMNGAGANLIRVTGVVLE